jgi:hypothetical protein
MAGMFGSWTGELSGCQSDVKNMMKYIKEVHGFTDDDITLLLVRVETIGNARCGCVSPYSQILHVFQSW